ncbi:hypothetical protein RFI_26778, partial [Reticulomyxa filosa]
APNESEAIDWVNCIHACARGDFTSRYGNTQQGSSVNKSQINGQDQQQAYETHNDELDEKLDQVLKGVKRIHVMTDDMNMELRRQDVLLNSIEDKIDRVDLKLKQQTRDMKKIT